MTTGTNIKDRCRLCYTRLKDSTSSHHKFWSSQHHQPIVNIYKRRPHAYRDFIFRYLSIDLPDKAGTGDPYSPLICSTCAESLDQLHSAFRTFEQTQKALQFKYQKASKIIQYQLKRHRKTSTGQPQQRRTTNPVEGKTVVPKRQSKRKGAPKHIDQAKRVNSATQLVVRVSSPTDVDDEPSTRPNSISNKRVNGDILTETTNHKKRFKRGNKVSESSNFSSNADASNCTNLLQASTSSDLSPRHLTASSSSSSSLVNSRPINSVKGNHIERIAVSLLSGTESQVETVNGTNGQHSNYHPSKVRTRRKPASSTFEATSTNNILSSPVATTYNNVATILSPSLDEPEDDELSYGDASNDSSTVSTSALQATIRAKATNIPNVNKQLSAMISTTPTAEGLTITAINQTGQKQVFMAKQLGNLKKYQCGLCEKIVTNIQIHVRRHTNDKPYPCTYCEKRFTNSGDLQIHVRIHTGEKPYACPLCLKSYRTIGNFNSHVKTHDSGTRPHRCELCNQTFPIPKDWYSHLRSSHRSRIPSLNSSSSTTVTKPLFGQSLLSQKQSEGLVTNKMKLEPIHRSQLIIKSSTNDDEQEPVNMSKKPETDDEEDDVDEEDDDDEENQSTHNLLSSVSSSSSTVVHV